MTQNERDLLLKDLCARLPYKVKLSYRCNHNYILKGIHESGLIVINDVDTNAIITTDIENTQPYLFPLSNISKDLINELYTNLTELELKAINDEIEHSVVSAFEIDFYHKHHIDYRGLIPMGLAIDATDKNIY